MLKKVINNVKTTKGRTLEVKLKEYLEDGTSRDLIIKCDQLYHADMDVAIAKLKPHLVHICDMYEKDMIIDINDFDNESLNRISVQQVSISGSSDAEGVVITGQKELSDKILNLNSPCTEVSGDYMYGAELAELIENIRFEASEYLFSGKYAIKQQEIQFPEEGTFEQDKETSEIASEILSNIADSIDITVSKKGKKGKSIQMITTSEVKEVAEAF